MLVQVVVEKGVNQNRSRDEVTNNGTVLPYIQVCLLWIGERYSKHASMRMCEGQPAGASLGLLVRSADLHIPHV